MNKRSLFMAFAAMLALGATILPSALKALSPKTIGYYNIPCTKVRDCSVGSSFCGYSNPDCTGTILYRAP